MKKWNDKKLKLLLNCFDFFYVIVCVNYFLNNIMTALLLMHVVWGIRFRIKWMINLKINLLWNLKITVCTIINTKK